MCSRWNNHLCWHLKYGRTLIHIKNLRRRVRLIFWFTSDTFFFFFWWQRLANPIPVRFRCRNNVHYRVLFAGQVFPGHKSCYLAASMDNRTPFSNEDRAKTDSAYWFVTTTAYTRFSIQQVYNELDDGKPSKLRRHDGLVGMQYWILTQRYIRYRRAREMYTYRYRFIKENEE